MSVQQQVLQRAAARIGYYAPYDPLPGSESGRYWANRGKGAWLAGPSNQIWWCMLFVSMVLDEVGQMSSIGGFSYNTDVTIRQARAAGCQFVSPANAQPGDVIIFNWDGGGTDHVGFVERNLGGGVLQTIEGNTSGSNAGSQSAGNGVWRRRRSHSIAAIIRPNYSGSAPAVAQTSDTLVVDGLWGSGASAKLQAALGTTVDGVVSSQYAPNQQYIPAATTGWSWVSNPVGSRMIEALQRKIGATADGIFGFETARKLQIHLGVTVDGYIGQNSTMALQQRLNAGTF